jgi:cell division protein FtsL
MRLLNFLVICALIVAAAVVYKIKFDSTLQAERVAKLRGEVRQERDAIASLRAECATLDTPGRIQGLTERHLTLKPIQTTQFDDLDHLPQRPAAASTLNSDPISAMLMPTNREATGDVSAVPVSR